MHLSQQVLEFLHFAFYYHFHFNLFFFLFQRKVFLHVVLLLIYIFLLVDLISKLYSLYIYIIWHVLCYWYIHFISRLLLSLSILINQSYTFFFACSVTTSRALLRRDSLLLDA